MKRLLSLLFVACLGMSCSHADTIDDPRVIDASFLSAVISIGNGGSGVVPILACNMGVFAGDGCGAAPAPLTASFARTNTFAPGGYINTTAATKANYMATNCNGGSTLCRPPYNVAGNGDDGYHIGYYSPLSSLIDPAEFDAVSGDHPVTGCLFHNTNPGTPNGNPTLGSTPGGGPELDCESGWSGTLQHFNLGPIAAHGIWPAHECTTIRVVNTSVTTVLFDDFYFRNDSGRCSTLGSVFDMIITGATSVTFSNYEMDGNSETFRDTLGAPACVTANALCNPIGMISAGFAATQPAHIRYGAEYDFSYYGLSTANADIKYSWFEGGCGSPGTCHAEWELVQASGGHLSSSIDHSLAMGIARQSQFSPGPMFFSALSSTVDALSLTNDVLINPFIGGAANPTGTVSGCLGQPPSGGTATSPTCAAGSGGVFYQTSPATLDAVGQGSLVSAAPSQCGSSTGGGLGPFIPGPYSNPGGSVPNIVGEWYIDEFTAGTSGTVANFALNSLTSLSGPNTGGTFAIASQACSGVAVTASIGSIATFSTHGPAITTQLTVQNVLSDFSSQSNGGYYSWQGQTATSFWASINGTAMLGVTALNYQTGDVIYSPSISSCTTSALSCPTITLGGTYPSTAPNNTGAPVSGSPINFTLGTLIRYTATPITSGTVTATIGSGAITSIGIVTPGSGYTNGTFASHALTTSGAGTGATATIIVSGGLVTSVTLVSGGSGYALADTLSASLAGGSGFSFPAAFSGLLSTNGQTVMLPSGTLIYDIANGTCFTAAPTSCPTVATTATGTSFSLNGITANNTTVAMTGLHQAASFSGTINNASPAAIAAGNVLLDAATVANLWGNNGGIVYIPVPSCGYTTGLDPAHPVTNCPQLNTTPAPPQTSFVLLSSGGTVGGVNSFVLSQAHFPTICSNPSIFSGNFDMANILSTLTLNPNWVTTPQFDQVGC